MVNFIVTDRRRNWKVDNQRRPFILAEGYLHSQERNRYSEKLCKFNYLMLIWVQIIMNLETYMQEKGANEEIFPYILTTIDDWEDDFLAQTIPIFHSIFSRKVINIKPISFTVSKWEEQQLVLRCLCGLAGPWDTFSKFRAIKFYSNGMNGLI